MSLRLHALGFSASWTAETAQFLQALAESSTRRVEAGRGAYRLWRSPAGAELWFHDHEAAQPSGAGGLPLSSRPRRYPRAWLTSEQAAPRPSGPVVAITPFHRGLSDCRIRIGRILTLDRADTLEGSCLAWLPAAEPTGREQAIVLELAPFALHEPVRTPLVTTAQILCCAHAIWSWPNAASYLESTPSNRRIRPGSFSPVTETDVTEVKLTYRSSPITLGLATGVVKRAIRHINSATGQPYYWLLLETRRGTFDVVSSPDVIEGDISEGNVAQVCGSFLARLDGTPV
jgi:hypothetical protein